MILFIQILKTHEAKLCIVCGQKYIYRKCLKHVWKWYERQSNYPKREGAEGWESGL